MSKKLQLHNAVHLEKLVHGGQALGTLVDGKKVFVWNGLPGESVQVQTTRSRKDYAEGIAVHVLEASEHRVATLGKDDIELSVAPWAVMDYDFELQAKSEILKETFARAGVGLEEIEVISKGNTSQYRNKIEFSFWGDEDGLHYAHYARASHRKLKLVYPYTSLVNPVIADAAKNLLQELNKVEARASDVKSVIFRCSSITAQSKVVAALFVKTKTFPSLDFPNLCVVYSNPKSPASVVTEKLFTNGDVTLVDHVKNVDIQYDVFSFFQVNLPVFEAALSDMQIHTKDYPVIDMYSGVGAIGLALEARMLVESDEHNITMAMNNVADKNITVIATPSEQAVDYIDGKHAIIVDPPRAGLHQAVIGKLVEVKPPKIIYLSCNPVTQARDITSLQSLYRVVYARGYNFFPRTPHIECLVVLERI